MLKLLLFLLLSSNVYAGYSINPYTGKLDRCMTIKEADGSPSNVACGDLKVSNGSLTDNGDGTYSLSTSGGSGTNYWELSSGNLGINTTNNVGIGSNAPTTKLDVDGTVRAVAFQAQSTSAGSLELSEASANGSNKITISAPSAITSDISCALQDDSTPFDNCISASAGYWLSNNVGINTTSNVGISSVNPTQKLDVNGNVQATNFIANGYSTSAPVIYPSTDANTGVRFPGPDIMALDTGGSTAITISSAQNVGVGTSSVTSKFAVHGDGSPVIKLQANAGTTTGSPYFNVYNNNLGSGLLIGANNSATSATYGLAAPYIDMFGANAFIGTSSAHDVRLMTGASERMRIASGGNIGIASTNPGKTLDVTGTVRATAFIGDGSGITGISSISGLNTGYISKAASSTSINDSVIFQSGSNIGISTTTPQFALDVNGSVRMGTGSGNVGIGSSNPGAGLDIGPGLTVRAVGLGTTVPQQLCRKADGKLGYFDGAWAGTCN